MYFALFGPLCMPSSNQNDMPHLAYSSPLYSNE